MNAETATETTTGHPLQSLDIPEVQSEPSAPAAVPIVNASDRDRRAPLSDWFKRPEHSDDQIALINRNYEEAKAAHVDATEKLERLNGEVRRFTEALDAPKEFEPIVAAAQAAEVRARVLDGGIAADEALRVLKAAQKRFDAAINAAREAEIVLPDVQAMVVEQTRVVDQKKQSRWRAEEALGDASAARVMHRGVRTQLTNLLLSVGSLQKLADEFGCALPLEIKLEHPESGGWFKPRDINPEA